MTFSIFFCRSLTHTRFYLRKLTVCVCARVCVRVRVFTTRARRWRRTDSRWRRRAVRRQTLITATRLADAGRVADTTLARRVSRTRDFLRDKKFFSVSLLFFLLSPSVKFLFPTDFCRLNFSRQKRRVRRFFAVVPEVAKFSNWERCQNPPPPPPPPSSLPTRSNAHSSHTRTISEETREQQQL